MVIIDVQRGGPSTGLPTKTEQADLLQVMFGRNGESPIPVIAPQSPIDCFDMAIEAVRMAVHSMTPVVILSEGYLANSSEPWLIPDPDSIAPIEVKHPAPMDTSNGQEPFMPFQRDKNTLARLSKAPVTGNVSYDPADHEKMVNDRAEKVARLAEIIPELDVFGPEKAELLVLSWGGTFGAARSAVTQCQKNGKSVAHAQLRYLNPFPRNMAEVLSRYDHILVPELNAGQLAFLLQGKFAMKILSYPKLHARPFRINEIVQKINEILD